MIRWDNLHKDKRKMNWQPFMNNIYSSIQIAIRLKMPINNLPQTMIILLELRTVLKVKNYASEVNRYKNA